ncbi:Xaa-Pro peptidase family protein [Conexibacter sp. SYSU D00693]|uniref:M24 family metallopeptidase n=1 Tax=Conexibacter sp. SYSU D00693 TaxID=2812560 RepID=UPI00196A727C|nr:M24 family metallopeptidase [Conexibacter sp. SYSU D00693]
MGPLVLVGDSERSAALRHEVGIAVADPFLLADDGERTLIVASHLDMGRLAEARPDAERIDFLELGFRELIGSGMRRGEVLLELWSRALQRFGAREALVPGDFPVAVADRLRADGLALDVDQAAVDERRRVKTAAEMDGIRRAQRAAEAGFAAVVALLRDAQGRDGVLHRRDGPALRAEEVQAAAREACAQAGAPAPPDVMVGGYAQGFGHIESVGELPAGLPIQVDLWPRDERSGCYADMTRTFVVGEVPDAVRRQEQLVAQALRTVTERCRPGVTGRELFDACCDVLEAGGHRTIRTGPGDDPTEGMQFGLGHGVGLEVHEAPGLGLAGSEPLVPGDVVAVEPGLWERDLGGVRFEDLLLVTEDGCEVLTDFPYDLTP